MSSDYQEDVLLKVSFLSESCDENDKNIDQYRKKIAELRQEIRDATQKIQQPDYEDGSDLLAELTAARSLAINMDCDLLKAKVTDLEAYVKDKKTEHAMGILEPMQAVLSILKLRVNYISHLEKLSGAYDKKKTFAEKFKKLAEILRDDERDDGLTLGDDNASSEDAPHIQYEIIPDRTAPETNVTLH